MSLGLGILPNFHGSPNFNVVTDRDEGLSIGLAHVIN